MNFSVTSPDQVTGPVTMVLVNLYPWYRKEHPFLEYEKKNLSSRGCFFQIAGRGITKPLESAGRGSEEMGGPAGRGGAGAGQGRSRGGAGAGS